MKIDRLDNSKISTSALNRQIQALISTADVAGLAVSIFNYNKVAYQKAFGYANLNKKIRLRTDHVFYAASFSKAVFGYLVAQLVAERILDLDKPLQEYLVIPIAELPFEKEWRSYRPLLGDERLAQITARMCMSHTTGFPNWRWMTKDGDFFPEGEIRFEIDPGTRYSYSGEGIKLLQIVVERILNRDLELLAKARVFDALEMDMTSYVWQSKFESKYCHGHTVDGDVIKKDTEDESNAAGSMETTIEDYSKFITKILYDAHSNSPLTDQLFHKNVRITSKTQFGYQSWEDTNENYDISLSYGLGWGILQSPHGPGYFKEGHGEGFQHYSIIFPENEMGVVIMSNSDNAESIFKALLALTIADVYTPWAWERYIPYGQ